MKNLLIVWLTIFLFVVMGQNTAAASSSSDWTWPLDGGIVLSNGLHATTLENTDYDVKNLDLVNSSHPDRITCFGVGWHRLYHAGVDLYIPGQSAQNAPVKSVAYGAVVFKDDSDLNNQTLIIKHTTYGVWSAYWHLKNITVSVGNSVQKGQIVGQVAPQDYTGRFPQVHPYNIDDSHLHFEIRTFEDGGNKFPNFPGCNIGYKPGIGYTFPDSPDNYGYLDPIEFLRERIPVQFSSKAFLPLVSNSSEVGCQQGANLIQYNAGFEYAFDDPRPWFEASTYFEPAPNLTYHYHIVAQESGTYTGAQDALFGRWLSFNRKVDEQLLQSIKIPANVDSLYWNQYIKLNGTDTGDRFFLSLQDAVTGQELISNVEVDHSTPSGQWFLLQVQITNASALGGKFISLNYNSIVDGDLNISTMRTDAVELITNCDGNRANNAPIYGVIFQRSIIEK